MKTQGREDGDSIQVWNGRKKSVINFIEMRDFWLNVKSGWGEKNTIYKMSDIGD